MNRAGHVRRRDPHQFALRGRNCSSLGRPEGATVLPAQGNAIIGMRGKNVEGRLRPFPPQAVLGPAFTPGASERLRILQSVHLCCHARSTGVLLDGSRRPVNGPDIPQSSIAAGRPGVNAGPNTACGGNARKRACFPLSASLRIVCTGESSTLRILGHKPNMALRYPVEFIAKPVFLIILLVGLLGTSGCQQKMAVQPSYKQLERCDFFSDERSERPLVPGTVARGHLQTDVAYFTGRREGKDGRPLGAVSPAVVQPSPDSPAEAKARRDQYADFVDAFPYPMTAERIEHGYQRFMIYCVVCHDPLGMGHGKIVERGYTPPPSYHIERLRNAPVGHLFAVASEGYGSMPSYGANPARRPLGHRGLYSRAAGQPTFPGRSTAERAIRREAAVKR